MKQHISKYISYSPAQMEEHLSHFLIDSWSYSKVSQFARNEKGFEMYHIYGERSKKSSTTIAGEAYHFSLERFFNSVKSNPKDKSKWFDLVTLQKFAYGYIDEVQAYKWKIQKTTPTVEECIEKCTKSVNSVLGNFFGELSTYIDEIEEVIFVELYIDEFISINGVDIPLPCHMKIDLVVRTTYGKIAIIDHKSRDKISDEKSMKLASGMQAITYVNGFEQHTGIEVDEVWFIENKIPKNKDKSPQLHKFKSKIDKDTRRLYEALLYEPLRKMIQAVNDPDYVYVINYNDTFIDMAEMFDFWCKTMIAEIEDFPVAENKKAILEKRLKKIRDAELATINPKIIKNFKQSASDFIEFDLSSKNMTKSEKVEHVLRTFGIQIRVHKEFIGFSSNTFLLEFSAGTKISSIFNHRLDIANALDVPNVRVSNELVMHEGKSYLGVEFAKSREKDLFFKEEDLIGHKIPIGHDNFGNVVYWDLDNHSTPHALVCGSTGSGKSVCLNSVIEYVSKTDISEIVVLDPKNEFSGYSGSKKVRVISDILEIEEELINAVEEMNSIIANHSAARKRVYIIDEFADAFDNSRKGKELSIYETELVGNYANGNPKYEKIYKGEIKSLEQNLKMLAQKGRSTGLRIMIAAQRASAKVINGDIKANFPVVICFSLPKQVDSMVVLDEPGAEALSGRGDGLIKSPQYPQTVRFQAYYTPNR